MWFKGFLRSICELTGFHISKKTKVIVPSHMIVRAQSSVAMKLENKIMPKRKKPMLRHMTFCHLHYFSLLNFYVIM